MKQIITKPSHPGGLRLIRYTILVISTIAVIFLAIDLGLAWIFVSGLIYPKCLDPQPLPDTAQPVEAWVATRDGHSIRIWYYPHKNGAVIISLGGLNGSLGTQIPPVKSLIRGGYGIVQVDTRACGVPPAPVTLGGDELYDAEAALAFSTAQAGVNPDQIGTIGFSMGGTTAIRLAARHPEIQAVVRDGGFTDLADMLAPTEGASIQQKIFQNTIYWIFSMRTNLDPTTVSPIQDIRMLNPRPVLLIYGEAEAESGKAQFEVASYPKELWIVPDGTHGRNHVVAAEEYEQRLLDFFNQSLLK